jgi:hypothetical protein
MTSLYQEQDNAIYLEGEDLSFAPGFNTYAISKCGVEAPTVVERFGVFLQLCVNLC